MREHHNAEEVPIMKQSWSSHEIYLHMACTMINKHIKRGLSILQQIYQQIALVRLPASTHLLPSDVTDKIFIGSAQKGTLEKICSMQ